jgi:hypothetical protein
MTEVSRWEDFWWPGKWELKHQAQYEEFDKVSTSLFCLRRKYDDDMSHELEN